MAGSKNKKEVRLKESPIFPRKKTKLGGVPDSYMDKYPSWSFKTCDKEQWSIFSDSVRAIFFEEIIDKFQKWENIQWKSIIVGDGQNTGNHHIDAYILNKKAQKRLEELCIEAESITSLRLTGTHRVYGYIVSGVFNILWVDLEHGDTKDCVCRSNKKHT